MMLHYFRELTMLCARGERIEMHEFEDLPEDAEQAFITIEKVLRQRRDEGERDQDGTISFIPARNYVVGIRAAAAELGIENFDDWSPPTDQSAFWKFYYTFLAELEARFVRIGIRKARRSALYTVSLDPKSKKVIRHLIEQVKTNVDLLEISDEKKFSLQSKLNAFLTELDRTRTRLDTFAAAFITLAEAGAEAHERLKPAFATMKELMDSAATLLGKMQSRAEEQRQIPAPEKPRQLPAPDKRDDT